MHEEKIVAHGIAVKKEVVIPFVACGEVAEGDVSGGVIGTDSVHDQAIDDLRFRQVRSGLDHAEHVFAEITAIALMGNPMGRNK